MSGKTPLGARRRVVGAREVLRVRRPLLLLPPVVVFVLVVAFAFALVQVPLDAAPAIFDFVSETAAPVSYAGPGAGVWMIAGVVMSVLLLRSGRRRISGTARVRPDHEAPSDFPGLTANGDVQS
jgi:hypothetical protein